MNKEIEYLKGHLYDIYKYKKSMKDLTYDMDIQHLLRTCKALDYSQKEIEKLNNIINKYDIFLKHELSFEGHSTEWIENKLQELKGSDNND